MDNIKPVHFDYIDEFVECVLDEIDSDEDVFIHIAGKYEEIRALIREFMHYDRVNISNIEINSCDSNGYADEYLLAVCCDDGEIMLGCEPAMVGNEYFWISGDICYIFSNCNSNILTKSRSEKTYELSICELDNTCDCDDCDDCDSECDSLCTQGGTTYDECSNDNNDGLKGFSVNKSDRDSYRSFSFYTNRDIDKDSIRDILKEFGF